MASSTPIFASSPRHTATPHSLTFPGRQSSDRGRAKTPTCAKSSKCSSAWETLGLQANATTGQIKKAYRKLVMLYHPDVAEQENTEEKFQQIHEAYLILQGKLEGTAASNADKAWDFHDWYWSFAAKHRKRGANGHGDGAFSRRTEGEQAVGRAKVSQQLHHLKARARCRASKESSFEKAVPPPEVHPAWAAVSSASVDELQEQPQCESASQKVAEPDREEHCQQEPYHHSHRPAGFGKGHLASQLSGLRRKAQLRDGVAA